MTHPAPPIVRWLAAFGLPGQRDRLADAPLPEPAWKDLVRRARAQRLAGFLHAAVTDGVLPVTGEQREAVDELHLTACAAAVQLERRLLDVAGALDHADVPFVVLKGTAVAHLDYPDPALRPFGDVDLLFPSAQFEHALDILLGLGYVRPVPEPSPGFDRRFGKGATLKGTAGDELDTHRSLVFGSFGLAIELDELFRSAQPFDLGGRRLQALGPDTRLLHACYHAALGDPRPRYGSVRDVAQMLTNGDRDPDRVIELSRRWRAHAVLARALELCRDLLGYPLAGPIVDAVADHRPTRHERRAIASYIGDNRTYAAKVVASLPYLDGVGAKVRFLRAVTLPSRDFTAVRGGDAGVAWIRRGLRSLRGGRTR